MTKPRWAFIHPFQLRLQRGIEAYLWELASALAVSGVEVDILTWAGQLEIPAHVSPLVKMRRVPSIRYFQSAAAIPVYTWHLTRNHYDHVFVHFAGYGEGPAMDLARKIAKIPFSVVFHFPPSLVPLRYDEFGRWRFQKDAEHLIGVSQATAREVEHWAGRSCDVISHAVDTGFFKPDAAMRARTRLELGVPTAAPVLVSVAALEERKGMQWVIQALPGVLEKYNDTRYWIVGDGPYRASLEEQIRALGLQEHVFLAGFQKDVKPYLAASDIALLLSHGEAHSISLLESAAMGLPIITSCHEPFPEIVRPEWGEMVDEKDRMVLVRKITDLLSGPNLREYKGKKVRAWVKSQHSWAQVAGQYRDLVEAIK